MTAADAVRVQTEIETPENIVLTFRLAGPASRMGAYGIDLIVRVALVWLFVLIVGLVAPVLGDVAGMSAGLTLLFLFLIEWGYPFVFEYFWSGRTPGKRIVGLRVIKTGGYPIGFPDALLRNLLRAADVLPLFYGTGIAVMFLTPRMQRIGDVLAGTMVVRERRESLRLGRSLPRDVESLPRGELNLAYRPADRTLALIERLLSRHATVSRARADEIAAILAPALAIRLGYDSEESPELTRPREFLMRVLKTFTAGAEESP